VPQLTVRQSLEEALQSIGQQRSTAPASTLSTYQRNLTPAQVLGKAPTYFLNPSRGQKTQILADMNNLSRGDFMSMYGDTPENWQKRLDKD
jgi:hypothetical protein